MSQTQSNFFSDRNTAFIGRVRNHNIKTEDTSKVTSPRNTRKAFNDYQNYSCIANPRNSSIYLSEATFSGKLLNNQNMMKEDINNKFLFSDNADIYTFDKAFSENTKQKDFYNETAKSLVPCLLEGINALVIAHGPARCGKSYSLRGNEKNEIGIIPRFARDLFAAIEGTSLALHMSVI